MLFNDGPIFLGLAELMERGLVDQALAHPYHPLYPAAVWLVGSVVAPAETAAAWVSIAAGTAAVALLYGLLRGIFDGRVAVVGAWLLAVHPYAVAHASDVQSDGLYLALFLSAATLGWRAVRTAAPPAAAAAGACAALAYLVRPEGLGVALVVALFAFTPWMRASARRRAVWVAALAVGALLLAGPYLAELRARHGSWVLTGKKSVATVAGLGIEGPRGAPSGWLDPERGASLVAERPFLATVVDGPRVPVVAPAVVGSGGRELARAWLAAARPEVWLLFAVGLVARRGRFGEGDRYLAVLAVAYGLLLAGQALGSGYLSKRHVLPVATLGFGWAAVGALALCDRALCRLAPGRSPGSSHGPWLAAGLACLALAAIAAPKTLDARREERVALRRAAEWVRARPDRGEGVAAGKQRVAYYADAPFVPLPGPAQGPLLAYLRASGARYVIVDEQRIDADAALRRATHEGLRLLHRVEARGRAAAVYGLPEGAGPRDG